VQIALGDEPINFLGSSYGSQLGAQYAALFPDNINTLALGGNRVLSQSEAASLPVEATSYDLTLSRLLAWAQAKHSSALKRQDAKSHWYELPTNAGTTAIAASSCNNTCYIDVDDEEIRTNTYSFLTFAKNIGLSNPWLTLASALYNASQGDASALLTPLTDPTAYSYLAISCSD
jgi:pimeloyl-ACP methyl ester carboxylesterase